MSSQNNFLISRNRIIAVLENCAKMLSARKEDNNKISTLVLRIRQLAKFLRNDLLCEGAVSVLYNSYTHLLSLQKELRDKPSALPDELLTDFEKIVEEGLNAYEAEKKMMMADSHSTTYYTNSSGNTSKELKELEQMLEQMKKDGKNGTKEYADLQGKITFRKAMLSYLDDMIKAKEKSDDQKEVFSQKVAPLTNDITATIKDIDKEQMRLASLYKLYMWFTIAAFSALLIWETILVCKLYPRLTFDDWHPYIPFYLPFPLVGGLLWISIYQMNRAQTHLMALASHMQQLRYKHSLLQTSMNLHADTRKNEEHVELLINKVFEDNKKDVLKLDKGEKTPVEQLIPINKIIELVKAISSK